MPPSPLWNYQVLLMSVFLDLLHFRLGSKLHKASPLPWLNYFATSNTPPSNDMVPSLGVIPLGQLYPTKMALPHFATIFVHNLL